MSSGCVRRPVSLTASSTTPGDRPARARTPHRDEPSPGGSFGVDPECRDRAGRGDPRTLARRRFDPRVGLGGSAMDGARQASKDDPRGAGLPAA